MPKYGWEPVLIQWILIGFEAMWEKNLPEAKDLNFTEGFKILNLFELAMLEIKLQSVNLNITIF